jgi:hypothetical protein
VWVNRASIQYDTPQPYRKENAGARQNKTTHSKLDHREPREQARLIMQIATLLFSVWGRSFSVKLK